MVSARTVKELSDVQGQWGRYSGFRWREWSKDFWGFEVFDCRIFSEGKFGKYFFGWLDLIRHFFCYSKTIWRFMYCCLCWMHSSANKVSPNFSFYTIILFNSFWKFLRFGNLGVNFSVISLGFVGNLRDYFGFWFLPWFDHPHHLRSGVPPWRTWW